jgi:hypothetical protein
LEAAGMTVHVHHRFGPHVIKLARLVVDSKMTPAGTVDFLIEVDRQFPGLSFHDFMGAVVLADALAMQPRGTA